MPIEILPEGFADWIESDSKPNINFLEIDPFWKTKTGTTDANKAILYRGGDGFLEMSINGGASWFSILPSTNPTWYDVADHSWWTSYPPMPMPDENLTPPGPSQLNYRSCSSNPGHTGEHSVLATHSVADGISDGNDDINTLYTAWILYTTNDWLTHGWRQLTFDLSWRLREESESGWDDVFFRGASSVDVTAVFKTAANQAVVFVGSSAYKVSWSGSAWSLLGSGSGGSSINQDNAFYYDGAVYEAGVTPDLDTSSPWEYQWVVAKWDVSGATPSYVGTFTSPVLSPDFTPATTNVWGFGEAWHMTGAGKLCLRIYMRDSPGPPYGEQQREWWFNTFDTTTSGFGTPYKYYTGEAEADDIPWGMRFTAENLGGDKFIVCSLEQNDWTNRATHGDYRGYVNIMVAGTWKVPSSGALVYEELLSADLDEIGPGTTGSKLFDNNRFGFVIGRASGANVIPRFQFVDYTLSPDTVTAIQYGGPDTLDRGDVMNDDHHEIFVIQNESVSDIAFGGDEIMWSEPDGINSFDHKAETISERMSDAWAALAGDFTTYIRARIQNYTGGSGLGNYVQLSTGTFDQKYPDYHYCRRHLGKISWDLNGDYLYIPTKDMYYYTDEHWEAKTERMERQGDGTVDYDSGFFGLQWVGWSDYLLDSDVPDSYSLNVAPWPLYNDAVLFYGLPYGVDYPTDPDQIYGYSIAGGATGPWYYIWGPSGFTEPCRGTIYTGGRLYAVTKGASFAKFYREKSGSDHEGGDQMEFVSNISSLPDPGIGTIDADDSDNAIAIAGIAADLVMVVLAASPYSSWTNITFSHRNDRGVTGLKVID